MPGTFLYVLTWLELEVSLFPFQKGGKNAQMLKDFKFTHYYITVKAQAS